MCSARLPSRVVEGVDINPNPNPNLILNITLTLTLTLTLTPLKIVSSPQCPPLRDGKFSLYVGLALPAREK